MQKKLEYLIKILIGATFFVPLIVIPNGYIFPFIVPKIVWFRALVMLMLGVYILLLSSNWQKYRIRLNPLNIIVGLFYLSFAVSTFSGVDWYRSFWDNHERMLGLFTITHFVLYYLIVSSVAKDWDEWKWLLRVFLFAGGLVMFIGVLQRFVSPELLLNRGAERVSATLGNPIYYSGYGLFLMFSGYLLAIKEYTKEGSLRLRSGWFWYAVVGGLLGFIGIFLGGTRGALLGFLAGFGILFVSYAIILKDYRKVRRSMFGLIILGLFVIGLLFTFRQTNFVKNIPAVGGLVNISLDSGTAGTRLMAWGVAVDAWQEKPIFGWGPNNYYYAFNKYYRAEFLEYGYGETWFDNAHSVIMNTLAVQGGVGIISYFGIFGVAIFMLWRGYKKGDLDAHIVSIGSAFLIAHLVSLVTVFENPTSYLYFFFFLALVNSQITDHPSNLAGRRSQIADSKNKNISTGLSVVVSLVILLMIYSTNINPARANKAALNVIRQVSAGRDITEVYADATMIPSPHIDDIRNDVARIAGNNISKLAENNRTSEAIKLFELVSAELEKNIELHPLDIRIYIQLAQLNTIGAQLKQDAKLIIEAERYLDEALLMSPKRQQIQFTLSNLKLQINKPDEAIQLLQDSIDNDPKIAEGWWRLVATYQQMGDIDKAKEIAQNALDQGVIFGVQEQNIINSILQSE